MNNDKYLTKFNYGNTIGYQVRLPVFKNGVFVANNKTNNHNEFFAKSKYKSWDTCKEAARIYRDDYLADNNAKDFLTARFRKHRPMTKSKSNSSGVIGVTYSVSVKESGTYYAYKALFSENKIQRTKQFAMSVHGDNEAFIKACRVRYQKEGILTILDETLIPCWPAVPYILAGSVGG